MALSKRTFLGSCLAGVTAFSGLPARAQAPRTLRIGYSIARTGGLATATSVQNNAYELWRDTVNQAGGLDIGGEKRRIELVSYDDQSQGAKAAQIYEKLILEDKVDLVLTPYATPMHIAIAPVLEKYQLPAVASTYGSTQLRDAGVKNMFFIQPLPDVWGKSLATMLKERGAKRVAVAALQNPFTLEMRKNVIADAGGAYQIVFDQTYPSDIKDMSALVGGIKAAGPDAIIVLSYAADSQMFVQASREASLTAPL